MNTQMLLLSRIAETPGFNPREKYGDEEFAELVESIRTNGMITPPLVRAADALGTSWSLVAGHRRVKAARQIGLEQIACVCLPYAPEADNLPLALIENLHRKDLDPIEKAKGFKRMMDRGLNKLQVGKVLGISDAYVGRMLSLLELPSPIQQLVTTKGIGQEAASHLATGLRQGLPKREVATLARTAAKDNLTGYEVRQEVRKALGDPVPPVRQPSEIYLSLPMGKKPVLDWALMRFGSLASALEALQAMHAPSAGKKQAGEPAPIAVGSDAVMGTWRDPMGVVRTAARRWPEFLVGMNQGTGGLIAVACGPLPAGFVLCCEVMPNDSVHIAATASGRTRTVGETIKDSLMGRRNDPSSGKKGSAR